MWSLAKIAFFEEVSEGDFGRSDFGGITAINSEILLRKLIGNQ
jgi:hypothetical protein